MFSMRAVLRLFAVFVGILGTSMSATAGGDVSSGGGAMVCRDAQGNIKSAQLLDLFEAPLTTYRSKILRSQEGVEIQLRNAIERVRRGYGPVASKELAEELKTIRERIVETPAGTELPPPGDAYPLPIPAGCKFEAAALYYDQRDILMVNFGIVNAMPPTDQAALWVHEAFYRERRIHGDTNSILVREYVGRLFSDRVFAVPAMSASSFIDCGSKVFVESNGQYRMFDMDPLFMANQLGQEAEPLPPQMSRILDTVDRRYSPSEWDTTFSALSREPGVQAVPGRADIKWIEFDLDTPYWIHFTPAGAETGSFLVFNEHRTTNHPLCKRYPGTTPLPWN